LINFFKKSFINIAFDFNFFLEIIQLNYFIKLVLESIKKTEKPHLFKVWAFSNEGRKSGVANPLYFSFYLPDFCPKLLSALISSTQAAP